MAQATVMLTSHGTNMYNAMWMYPGSILIEVTLRPGSCCADNREDAAKYTFHRTKNPDPPLCFPDCSPYYLSTPINYISSFGIRWRYYDPEYTDQSEGRIDQRGAHKLYVIGEPLAGIVEAAHQDVLSLRRSHKPRL